MRIESKYDPCENILVNFKTIGWIILNKKAEKVESKIVVMLLGRHFVSCMFSGSYCPVCTTGDNL